MNSKYKPQERWQNKVGLISKSYKLNEKIVSDFAKACNTHGTSQAKQLTLMMTDFVIAVNEAEKLKNKAENIADQKEETE
jgi:hypothetical protein